MTRKHARVLGKHSHVLGKRRFLSVKRDVAFVCRAENEAEKLDVLVICAGVNDEVLHTTHGVKRLLQLLLLPSEIMYAAQYKTIDETLRMMDECVNAHDWAKVIVEINQCGTLMARPLRRRGN